MRRCVLAALAVVGSTASARTPMTNGVYLRPGDDHARYVRTTLGLLISHDDGCSFRWVCEQAIGYGGGFDPKYAIAADGTIFAATFHGLRVSRDGGCSWVTATAELGASDPHHLADAWVDAIDLGPDGSVWIVTAESAKPNDVYESTDGGLTFSPRGLFSRTVWYKSVRVAPSDPDRIYATGYQVAGSAVAHLYRSDDAGRSWHELPVGAPIGYGATPILYVMGVDPANPDVLYVTSAGAHPPNGDRLYRSEDGGRSFREVLQTGDAVRDLVFRAQGVIVATQGSGSYAAVDGVGFTSLGRSTPQLACLAGTAEGTLVGCGANWQPDNMALASSTTGTTWRPLFRFGALAGPLTCPSGTTVHERCAPQWPALQQQLGAIAPTSCPAVPPAPGSAVPSTHRTRATRGGGCCDASGDPPGAAMLIAAVAVALGARRRGYGMSRQLG